MDQLADNIGALDVKLTPGLGRGPRQGEHSHAFFPADMLSVVPSFAYGGTTINGTPSKLWPPSAAERPANGSNRVVAIVAGSRVQGCEKTFSIPC